MDLVERPVRPSSPVPLSLEQFILPSQAVHKQPENVRGYALSVVGSREYAALFADDLTNVGKQHDIARLQKSTRIQHTALC